MDYSLKQYKELLVKNAAIYDAVSDLAIALNMLFSLVYKISSTYCNFPQEMINKMCLYWEKFQVPCVELFMCVTWLYILHMTNIKYTTLTTYSSYKLP